jgi:hypothetical protein
MALEIKLKVGETSFSAIPQYFKFVLGFAGSISTLPKFNKEWLTKSFEINQFHAIPSLFYLDRNSRLLT